MEVPKVVKPTNKKRYYKTLGSVISVIKSPNSSTSLLTEKEGGLLNYTPKIYVIA